MQETNDLIHSCSTFYGSDLFVCIAFCLFFYLLYNYCQQRIK
ncbi:hypothetical protein RV03_GL003461 [Enterococcus gallinarum]|nr:hypothetical protein RV03_GL003461 [Enterococcus gallinarum]